MLVRTQNTATPYSNRAYYFGLISLVLYFVQNVLQWTKMINDRNNQEGKLPDFLLWITLLVLLFSCVATIYNALRSIKERKTFKGIVGFILAIACFLFVVFMIIGSITIG